MTAGRRFASTRWVILALMVMSFPALGCGFVGGAFGPATPTPAPTAQFKAVPMTIELPTPTLLPTARPTGISETPSPEPPVEQLIILKPTENQGVRGSIRVEGTSDPAFEQPISILIRDQSGNVVGSALARIQVAAGQRGRFAADVPLPAYLPAQPGRVVAYALSPRDGGPTHLASVDVQLNSDAAPPVSAPSLDQREMIVIVEPAPGARLQGQVRVLVQTVLVTNLVVEVRGANNETLGRQTRTLENVAGRLASLVVDVPFSAGQAGPGRVVVYALHPRDGQTLHLSSVEVNLQP